VSEATERSPALRYLEPEQVLEVSPSDAERLGVGHGDSVVVSSNGTSLTARLAIRERVRPGAGFLIEGISGANANALPAAGPVEVKPTAGGDGE
jgi:anaerobic selenocysteine-containing dehydrogenase